MKKINYLFALLLVISLAACSKDEEGDKKSPLMFLELPVENQEYMRGGTLRLSATFEDDVALKECRVNLVLIEEIPYTGSAGLKGIDLPWEPEEMVIPLNETYQEVKDLILFGDLIPYEIMSGIYKLKFDVYDQAKNPARYEVLITIE